MNSHIKRWITGVVAVPLIILLVSGPSYVFCIFITILILGAVYEYNSMVFKRGFFTEKVEGMVIGILIPISSLLGGLKLMFAVATFSLITSCLVFLYQVRGDIFELKPLVKVVFGFMYIPVTISYIIVTHSLDNGAMWVFLLIVIAFSSDVSAFYAGRTWGKRKLMPLVSAGKTVEGAIGSIAGSILGCLLFRAIFFEGIALSHTIIIAIMANVLGQTGDLFESAVKRVSLVKDSGSLIPGHGGVLDRLDSFTFIIPFVYYYIILVIQ
ncbi:MAG: phosphatidate cytidylyltransferase [Deltaproteobacteria bacterium]|nr:phosphatidate cytidylyltransferase [Deltaproteobacteria bacterium]